MTAIRYVVAGVLLGAAALLLARRAGAPPMPRCREQWAAHHGGRRDMSKARLIVLHSTEGDTAASAAGWFQSPDSAGSAHVVVDDVECVRTLPDDVEPWGAAGANHDGLHLEMAGHALKYSRADWLSHVMMLDRAAGVVAAWSRQYRIPVRFVDAAGLRRGERGVTTHREVTRAYSGGAGHVDPGPAFPLGWLLDRAGGRGPGKEYVA
jgi:hypothetical protein